jgi:hypothetical protein
MIERVSRDLVYAYRCFSTQLGGGETIADHYAKFPCPHPYVVVNESTLTAGLLECCGPHWPRNEGTRIRRADRRQTRRRGLS